MFHSAGTGIDDQVPVVGGAVGMPDVGMKSQLRRSLIPTSLSPRWSIMTQQPSATILAPDSSDPPKAACRRRLGANIGSINRMFAPHVIGCKTFGQRGPLIDFPLKWGLYRFPQTAYKPVIRCYGLVNALGGKPARPALWRQPCH
jgi:hypothetical protein